MKRKLLVLTAIFMVLTLIFTAGSCEGAFDALFGTPEPAPDIDPKDVVGTWTRELSGGTETFTFSDSMKYVHNKLGVTGMGTYTVSGNTITTTASENSRNVSTHIVRFSEDKNTMTWGEGSIQAVYTRVE